MVRLALPRRGVAVVCAKPARCPTVESANTAKTWSSLEVVGGASRHVSDGDAPTWPFRVLMMERRTLNKTSRNW